MEPEKNVKLKWKGYPVKKGTRVTSAVRSSKSILRAINDIYIIEEDPIETVYDTGLSAEVTEAIKSSKLIVPDAYSEYVNKYPCKGKVIARGDKCKYDIKVGDRVIYARLGVQRYQLDKRNICDVREIDIHGILSD